MRGLRGGLILVWYVGVSFDGGYMLICRTDCGCYALSCGDESRLETVSAFERALTSLEDMIAG